MLELGFGLIGCASFLFASVVLVGMIIQQPWLLVIFVLVWFLSAMKNASAEPTNDEPPPAGERGLVYVHRPGRAAQSKDCDHMPPQTGLTKVASPRSSPPSVHIPHHRRTPPTAA